MASIFKGISLRCTVVWLRFCPLVGSKKCDLAIPTQTLLRLGLRGVRLADLDVFRYCPR
jgi:hypothetical protein